MNLGMQSIVLSQRRSAAAPQRRSASRYLRSVWGAGLVLAWQLPLLAQAPIAPGERIFEDLHVTSSASLPAAMAASPSGRYLYAGEGGMVAVLDTQATGGMSNPIKTFQVSSLGIVPIAMRFDPTADIEAEGEPGSTDLLYVAAGRDGLWVVHADRRPNEPNQAIRIDDSGNANPATQNGRRWACDLEFATVNGVDYLLSLTSRKNQSRLRLYRLSDLRSIAQSCPGETGCEIAPAVQVNLNANASTSTDWFSYAFGMTVDYEHAIEGGADVYVALGAHGLVRVRLQPPQGSAYPMNLVQDGPFFGSGSVYADPQYEDTQTGIHSYGFQSPLVPWKRKIYDDLEYYDWTPCLGDVPASADLTRTHPPIFTDVTCHGGFLYAAVESCGWVRFDLSDDWQPAIRIDHHEGWQNQERLGDSDPNPECSEEEFLLRLIASDGPFPGGKRPLTWPRRIVAVETDGGPILAVTTSPDRMAFDPGGRTEGRAHNEWPRGEPFHKGGYHAYTFLYRLGCGAFQAGVDNWDVAVRLGGQDVLVPPAQGVDFCHGEEPGSILFFATAKKLGSPGLLFLDDPLDSLADPAVDHSNYRVEVAWNTPNAPNVVARSSFDRPGRFCRYPGVSILDQRVWLTGSNDAGFRFPGPEWTCDGALHRGSPPTSGADPNHVRGGILVNPEAQWPHPTDAQQAYLWTVLGSSWAMVRYSIGQDLCCASPPCPSPTPPQREKRAFISSPPDRFESGGRGYYSMGGVWPEYDAWFATQEEDPGAEIVFGTRSGTDWGLVVMRRDKLQSEMEGASDGSLISPITAQALVGTLVTAHELSGVDSASQDAENIDFLTVEKLTGYTTNAAPRFFELSDETLEPQERFLVVLPTGRVSVHPDDSFMAGYTIRSPYDQRFGHPKVTIFDVTNVQGLTTQGSPSIPSWTLIGPNPGFAAEVRVLEYGGTTWLFLSDFTGELLVYDVGDLLQMSPGTYDHTTFPPFEVYTLSDDFTDTFRSDLYSVALDHVEWVDDSEQAREEVYVYLGASRVGLEVLRFRPGNTSPPRLEPLGIVQVPGEAEGLWIRTDPDSGQRQLMVCNSFAGIRILEYAQ